MVKLTLYCLHVHRRVIELSPCGCMKRALNPMPFMKHPQMILFAFASLFVSAHAEIYHVDSSDGDDSRNGLSPELAWRSLEKANATVLKPGDQLLFKAGSRWSGQFTPKGSGDSKAKVLIGCYGDGALPRIDGEGKHLDTVLLKNFSFVEMADLEITNLDSKPIPWRTGITVLADGIGKMEQVSLKRLYVHDVNGDLRKSHEGCGIFFEAKGANSTYFDSLLIEECRLERTDRNGICQRATGKVRSKNVIIRGNTLNDIGGDGIKLWGTDGGLIEKNVVRKSRARCEDHAAGIWPFACDDTVIQFNEVSDTVGTKDGQAFDADYWCRRTIFQYNYSFRNQGGFILLCTPGNAISDDTVIRYNISVHDGANSARVFHFGGGAKRTLVYNNTIIIGPKQNVPMLLFTEWDGGKAQDTNFSNNLFIVENGGRASYDFGTSSGNVFQNNVFAGRHEGLPQGVDVTPVPALVRAMSPAPGMDSVKVYRPSNAKDFPRGRLIQANGGRDILGNPVSSDQPPAIGAIEPARVVSKPSR